MKTRLIGLAFAAFISVCLPATIFAQVEGGEEKGEDLQTDDPDDASEAVDATESADSSGELSVLDEREIEEEDTVDNPYVFVAHKPNFLFPISYTTALNDSVYEQFTPTIAPFYEQTEVEFQVSLKVQANRGDLFYTNDALQFGLTITSFWQVYATDISSPFRETNYEPEVFYTIPFRSRPLGLRPSLTFGLVHQSNGQIQGLSRSWNRIFFEYLLEGDHFYAQIKPWYRIPESDGDGPDDPRGDDNPDITDFMGFGELSLGYRGEVLSTLGKFRLNPATGKGAVDLSLSFPLFSRFRGLVQYFNGYGDSLIDYNNFQQRIGIGILFSNLF